METCIGSTVDESGNFIGKPEKKGCETFSPKNKSGGIMLRVDEKLPQLDYMMPVAFPNYPISLRQALPVQAFFQIFNISVADRKFSSRQLNLSII